MKASFHPKEEILHFWQVMTHILREAAEKQTVPRQILWSGTRMPIDVFPTAKFITAIPSVSCSRLGCFTVERGGQRVLSWISPPLLQHSTQKATSLCLLLLTIFTNSYFLCDSIKNVVLVNLILHGCWKIPVAKMTHSRWHHLSVGMFNLNYK